MVWLKYVGGVLVVIALCAVIWFIHPAKGQVKQLEEKVSILEEQIGFQYSDAMYPLKRTVEALIEWDYKQSITDVDEGAINDLSEELFASIQVLFFVRNKSVHPEWEDRMYDVHWYLRDYLRGNSLTNEEIADLNQALKAIYFIAMDFNGIVRDMQASYDAMHDEEHEMVERVKYRLSTEY